MQELVLHTINFWFEAVYWQTNWCDRGVYSLVYRQISATFMAVTTIYFANATFRPNAVWYVSYQSLSVLDTLNYGSCSIFDLEIGLMAGVTGRQGWLLLLCIWSHPWYIQRSVFAKFLTGLMRLMTVCYLCHFMLKNLILSLGPVFKIWLKDNSSIHSHIFPKGMHINSLLDYDETFTKMCMIWTQNGWNMNRHGTSWYLHTYCATSKKFVNRT
jgi:hypothetical protein